MKSIDFKNRKIVIYGYGTGFVKLIKGDLMQIEVENIIAIADKNRHGGGVSIDNKKDIPLIAPEDIELYTYDYIVISSTKYSDEILEELLSRNICRDKILCIKDLENKIWGAYHDKLILNGVDIGGPSGLFEGIYEEAWGCDIVNYSKNNIWSQLGEGFLWKNRVLGNVIEADATELGKIENDRYDFVLSSNNLEHIANPIKALKE